MKISMSNLLSICLMSYSNSNCLPRSMSFIKGKLSILVIFLGQENNSLILKRFQTVQY